MRFQQQLADQLTFIRNSCLAYDAGQWREAIRVGTSLRVLLHDTGRSPSLLSHLHAKDVPLLSTCPRKAIPSSVVFFDGLTTITFSSAGAAFRPKLASQDAIEIPAQEWWEQLVLRLGDGRNLSRKVLARTATNKDGGAHVDEKLPAEYALLGEGVYTMLSSSPSASSTVVSNHHLVYLRQMGYEILNSPKLQAIAA